MKILIIGNTPQSSIGLVQVLNGHFNSCEFVKVFSQDDFDLALDLSDFDLVLTNYRLDWTTGLNILNTVKQRSPHLPVIMIADGGNEAVAVQAMKAGLSDYVPSENLTLLSLAVSESLERAKDDKDREEALRQLQISEERYRLVSEVISDYAFSYLVASDDRLLCEWVTAAFSRITGYTLQEMEAKGGWISLVHPDDLAIALQHHSRLASGMADVSEYRIVTKAGTPRWLRTYARPVLDSTQRRVIRIYGASQDISEKNINRLMESMMHQIDRMVLQEQPIDQILSLVCARMVGVFGFPAVWIGMKETDGSINIPGRAGQWIETCLESVPLQWNCEWQALGLAGKALCTGLTQKVRPNHATLWHWRRAGRYGVRMALAVPLQARGQILGVLNLYAERTEDFDDEQIGRFENLAARIAVAILVAVDQHQLRVQGAALGSAANAIFITNSEGRIEWVNPAFSRMSGYEPAEVLGLNPRLLKSDEHRKNFFREFWEVILDGHVWRGELVNRRKDGSFYTVRQTVVPLLDAQDKVTHFVAIQEDITAQRQEEFRMAKLAYYDPLTDLPNRVLFNDRLRQAIILADRNGWMVAVLFVDLDRFKRINDTLGHDAGDMLLTLVAKRLQESIRKSDSVARLAGDEFTLILPEIKEPEVVSTLAEKIMASLSTPYQIKGHDVQMTASMGLVLYPLHASEPESLVNRADIAMYRAKQQGKNCYCIFEPAMETLSDAVLALELALPKALETNQLVLYYQLLTDLATDVHIGVEALVRWQHPDLGLLQPGHFIPMAEESGLIVPLGEWVLEAACRQVRAWHLSGLPKVRVSVNFSAQQFKQPNLVQVVSGILQKNQLDPNFLEIEITETDLMRDTPSTVKRLAELKAMGIRFSIDDFGTGYSSFSYLKRFAAESLKIDRSFIRGLGKDADDTSIVKTIIDLAHNLGMKVIAEGVEFQHQLDALREYGCDMVQGFYYSRPIPAHEIVTFLTEAPVQARAISAEP